MTLKRMEGSQQNCQGRGCLSLHSWRPNNGKVKVRKEWRENCYCLCVGVKDDGQPKGGLIHFDCKLVMTSRRRNPFAKLPELDKDVALDLGLLSVTILRVG